MSEDQQAAKERLEVMHIVRLVNNGKVEQAIKEMRRIKANARRSGHVEGAKEERSKQRRKTT